MKDKIDIKLMNFLEEIKAFVKTTVKESEISLINEIQKVCSRVTSLEVRLERTQEGVVELRHNMKAVKATLSEHDKQFVEIRGEMKEMESRLATKIEIREMEGRLSDKIDKVGERVEVNEVRLDHHIAHHA